MSNLGDFFRQRRSVRKYQPKDVPDSLVLEVLEAAGWAPSAHNSQPWRFIVLRDPKVKLELAERMAQAWANDLDNNGYAVDEKKHYERMEDFSKSPVMILACLTMEGLRKFNDERQSVERDLAVESLAAAVENLLLAAHAAGLGACWYCAPAFCKGTVCEVLKIPAEVEPSALIVMGYPAEKTPVPPKKALNAYCYLDVWGKPLSH
ncbi:MAG: nitroreductase family protein [Candidatus Bathyarchaeia archaeon]|jgi:F420 biosynthesis protein FbiB-like protein